MDKWKLEKQILNELRDYDITHVDDSSSEYPLDDYYPLRFILHLMENKDYLPKLETLLRSCSDEDLVYKDTNALMWSGHHMVYEKLLLLKDRQTFIKTHIHDRDSIGRTALHYVAGSYTDEPEAIRLLVAWGADVNAKDSYLYTPLHYAAFLNHSNDYRWKVLKELGALSSQNLAGETPEDIDDRMYGIDAW